MFETILQDLLRRFGLGGQARPLLRELVALATEPKTGGLGAFLDKFRSAGLADAVASWVGRGPNQEISGQQLEQSIGRPAIDRLAAKVGLTADKATPALAFLTPRVVEALTPDGRVPATLPPGVQAFLTGGTASGAAVSGAAAGSATSRRWWLWLLLGLLLVGGWLLYQFVDRPGQETATAPATVQPAAAVDPKLSLSHLGDTVQVSGVVRDENSRSSIMETIRSIFGAGKVKGDVTVDPRAGEATWLGKLRAALEGFTIPGADLMFDGNTIKIGGFLSDTERSTLMEKLESLFGGGFTFGFLGDKAVELYEAASERTLAALGGLKTGYTGAELVQALNLSIIRFETGSATITAENEAVLARSAEAIKGAPAGTVIEVGGHTDSTGDPAANLTLSQNRAAGVRQALIDRGVDSAGLTAKGYGDTVPLAGNDTAWGRFQNRRIGFTLVQ
jgi:outer membrane protein OmpA-like peptidoglycan-associated protein/uncharacterized protein YidB (DUF937 family)